MKPLGVLLAIAEGRQQHEWTLQSHLMAMIAAAVGDENATPDRFNPFEQGGDEDEEVIEFSEARALLREHG